MRDGSPAHPTRHTRLVPLVVACPLFLQNLDSTVMATALPTIAASLQVRVLDLNLAITTYLLSLAIFLPASGWLADRFGAKRLFVAAIVVFAFASALCGAAQTLGQLVACRLLQGLGGAMMVPVGRLILLRNIAPALMVSAMVWFTVPGAFARLLGPLVGGAIVSYTSWRWIFLVNIPFGLLGAALAWWLIRDDPPLPRERRHRFDAIGFVLLAFGLAGVLGAVELSNKSLLPWQVTVAMGALGVLALWAYVRHSRRLDEPLIDLGILRYPTYRAAVLGGMPLRIGVGAAPFLLPLMMQLGFGLSPIQSGLLTMAVAVGALSTRTLVARAIRAMGFRTLLMLSSFMAGLFYACYGFFTPDTPHVLMFGVMMFGGLFNSMAMVSLNTLGFSEIPGPRMSHATAASSMAQQLSVSLGVVMGAMLLAVTSLLHGGDAVHLQARDFMPAFLAVGAMTMISVAAFRRLDPDEGDELRGR